MKVTLDRVNAEREKEAKKVEQTLAEQQKQFEIDKRSWSYPTEKEILRAGYSGTPQVPLPKDLEAKAVITSRIMSYNTAFTEVGVSTYSQTQWRLPDDERVIRAQIEEEYKIKLKNELSRMRRELTGDDGRPVDIDILAQGRKFKLEGE